MMNDNTVPTVPVMPAPTSPPETPLKTSLSLSESSKMAEWAKADFKAGRISEAQMLQQFDELQTPPEQRDTVETRTPEQLLVDQQFPIPRPEAYLVRLYSPGNEPARISPEDRQKENMVRSLLHEMGMTRELGNAVAQMALKTNEHLATLTPQQREDFKEKENQRLRALYRDQLDATLEPVRRMTLEVLERLEKQYPRIREFAASVTDHALLVAQLVQTARNYHIRHGRG